MFDLNDFNELGSFIQPFVNNNFIFDTYILISLVVLFVYAIIELWSSESSFETVLQLFYSEQFTYMYYASIDSIQKFKTNLSYLFIATQIAYFLPFSFVSNLKFNFLLIVGLVFLFFLFKKMIYKSLLFLLKGKLDVDYLLFNNQLGLFYYSVLILLGVVVSRVNNQLFTPNTGLLWVIICTLLFYIWFLYRLYFVSTRDKFVRSVYFFLYLCALEFAPVLIGMKIVDVI